MWPFIKCHPSFSECRAPQFLILLLAPSFPQHLTYYQQIRVLQVNDTVQDFMFWSIIFQPCLGSSLCNMAVEIQSICWTLVFQTSCENCQRDFNSLVSLKVPLLALTRFPFCCALVFSLVAQKIFLFPFLSCCLPELLGLKHIPIYDENAPCLGLQCVWIPKVLEPLKQCSTQVASRAFFAAFWDHSLWVNLEARS